MSIAIAILSGAKHQLLPISIPYRFFISAAAFHLVGWVLLAFGASEMVSGYSGGPGFLPAAVHAMTLGVLAMTIMGASYQVLPVASGQGPIAQWPCRLSWWLMAPGVALILYGFSTGENAFALVGTAMGAAALLIFALVVGDIMRRTQSLFVLVIFGWASLASLLALMALGLTATLDWSLGFLENRPAIVLTHLLLAAYGFVGMLALGYSHILVPMFALSPPPPERWAIATFALSVFALTLAVIGALFSIPAALILAAAIGLVASFSYIKTMREALKEGMRKKLGVSFILIKAAWAMLPISLVAGAIAATGVAGDQAITIFVFLILCGWLLTFLLGVLQRIIPFLAGMNAGKVRGRVPRLSKLAPDVLLKVHMVGHFSAIALIVGGLVASNEKAIAAGGIAGAAGAIVFLAFTAEVFRRLVYSRAKASSTIPEKKETA